MSFPNSFFNQISLIGSFWQEKANNHLFRWNLLLITYQLVFIFLRFNNLPQQVPLYYSMPWGESQLASAASLFLLPAYSFFVLIFNNLIATAFLKTTPFFSRLLTIFSLIFSLFASITITKIILLIS